AVVPAMKKTRIAHVVNPGHTKIASRTRLHIATVLTTVPTRLPNIAYAMWPPSSWPIGRRFNAVTNRPSQPANARGLRRRTWPYSSVEPSDSLARRANRIDEPALVPIIIGTAPPSAAITVDDRSPISNAGIATTRPASRPATATSKRARRFSVGDRI